MTRVISIGLFLTASLALAQTPPAVQELPPRTPAKSVMPPPPPATDVAATVNSQPIPRLALYRAFVHAPAKYTDENKKDMLNFLIDNVLVDQYLYQLKIDAPAKLVDERYAQIEVEAKKSQTSLKEMLAKMFLSEDDLRRELIGSVRWDTFLAKQSNDAVLRDLFDKNQAMFNGSLVSAHHILQPAGPESVKQAMALKLGIEKAVADSVAKMPAGTPPLQREQTRAAILLKTFEAQAMERSTCPSKAKGGDLGEFPRIGAMVEPFAKTAFELQPFQISNPVETQFGVHLILVTQVKPGRPITYDQAKPFVQEIYGERLRDAIVSKYRPISKIVVNPEPK